MPILWRQQGDVITNVSVALSFMLHNLCMSYALCGVTWVVPPSCWVIQVLYICRATYGLWCIAASGIPTLPCRMAHAQYMPKDCP